MKTTLTYRTYGISIWTHGGGFRSHDVVACDQDAAMADVLQTYGIACVADLLNWSVTRRGA